VIILSEMKTIMEKINKKRNILSDKEKLKVKMDNWELAKRALETPSCFFCKAESFILTISNCIGEFETGSWH